MTRATPIPVLTAVADAAWEVRLVGDLAASALGVTVVRRCVDLADLLAVAATGIGRVAVVSADLRRLDRDALARLSLVGVAVVGVVAAGAEHAEQRLRQLGVAGVVAMTADPAAVAAVIVAASQRTPSSSIGFAVPGTPARAAAGVVAADGSADAPISPPAAGRTSGGPLEPGSGRLIAVWGPAGAPGRTSVALGLAAEFAGQGRAPLLVDADVYGGTVAALLGMLEETPGLAAACRLANAGTLDVPRLAALARTCGEGFRVLPGISRPARWPELRTAAFETVLELCRSLAQVTVVDCGFSLERDEELMYDTAAPQRNGATLAALAAADTVVVVGSGDPVGLQRLVRGLAELAEVIPGVRAQVVINRVRRSAVGGNPKQAVGSALSRYAGVLPSAYLPYDLATYDAAVAAGRTVAEVAPGSAVRKALTGLAEQLGGALWPKPVPAAAGTGRRGSSLTSSRRRWLGRPPAVRR